MRIRSFRIENWRNLRLAEFTELPDFVVICGGNGSGKSALLEGLMAIRQAIVTRAPGIQSNTASISADSTEATLSMTLEFSHEECIFGGQFSGTACAQIQEVSVVFSRHTANRVVCSEEAVAIIGRYFRSSPNASAYFDYLYAHRVFEAVSVGGWSPTGFDELAKSAVLGIEGVTSRPSTSNTKSYLETVS